MRTVCFLSSIGVISNWTDESRIPPCTIYQAFKYFLDITTPPSPLLLQQFAPLATNEKQRKRLEVLSKVGKTNCVNSHKYIHAVTIKQHIQHNTAQFKALQRVLCLFSQPNLPALLILLIYSEPLSDTSSACS